MKICLSTLLWPSTSHVHYQPLDAASFIALTMSAEVPCPESRFTTPELRALPIFPPRAVSIHSCMPSDFFIASRMAFKIFIGNRIVSFGGSRNGAERSGVFLLI